MPQSPIPLQCFQGADFYLPLIWSFGYCNVDYPLNITGYTIEMQVKESLNSYSPLVSVSTMDGNIIVDGDNGKIEIWIPNAITSGLPLGTFIYGVKVTNIVGLIENLLYGQFSIEGMVPQ